jgi:hypothetical protein
MQNSNITPNNSNVNTAIPFGQCRMKVQDKILHFHPNQLPVAGFIQIIPPLSSTSTRQQAVAN